MLRPADELVAKLVLPLYRAMIFLVPGANAAVVNVAVPPLSAGVARTEPLLTSVSVTDPVGVPAAEVTWAAIVTGES